MKNFGRGTPEQLKSAFERKIAELESSSIESATETPIATYYVSGDLSILIYGIEYSIDDLVRWAWSNSPDDVKASPITYGPDGGSYFDADGTTVDLSEAIRACDSITGADEIEEITEIDDRGEYISALSNSINDELSSNGLSSTVKAEDESVKVIVSDGNKITEFDVPNEDLKWKWDKMEDDVQYIAAEVVEEFSDAIEGSCGKNKKVEASDTFTVDDWMSIVDQLNDDVNRGVNPVAEYTPAGAAVSVLCGEVEDLLAIQMDLSPEDDEVYVYDEYSDPISDPIEYDEYIDIVFDLAVNSASAEEFKQKYRAKLEDMLNINGSEASTSIEADIDIEPGQEYSFDDFEDDPYAPNIDPESPLWATPGSEIDEIKSVAWDYDVDENLGYVYNLNLEEPAHLAVIKKYGLVADPDNESWYYDPKYI